MNQKLFTENILNIAITSDSQKNILELITTSLEKKASKLFITTPNPEILVYAAHHPVYKSRLNSAQIALPDGIGLLWAARLLKKPLKARITGVDFMKSVCAELSNRPETIGLLGGKKGVAEETAKCLRKMYPNLRIAYAAEEWDEARIQESRFMNHESKIVNRRHIDILFVAYGFPKQENWIYENLPTIPVTAAMGVGGAFDYISGRVSRAPVFVQKIGLEWLWRLVRQPWRIKRQIKLLEFVFLVLKERVGK